MKVYPLIFILMTVFSPSVYGQNDFNASVEFPNFFLPQEYRSRPQEVPQQIVNRQRALLEAAIASVFHRLEVPITVEGEVKNVRYFSHLDSEISKITPNVELVPSGGVVRSVISLIYSDLFNETLKPNPKSPNDILNQIAQSRDPIPAYRVRGVGSDFDVLLRCRSNCSDDEIRSVKDLVNRLTNASAASGARVDSAIERSIYTVADIKEYDQQTSRSVRQGGATIDFLAFDRRTKKFIEPNGHKNIVDLLIRGKYEYAPPIDRVEETQKQTGMRSFDCTQST